ncbi:hypothetical protein HY249_00365 [Candidatus Azambacteria bacterium]|nr:hypothetical protein [Candidatus Azambacteria bacterium]
MKKTLIWPFSLVVMFNILHVGNYEVKLVALACIIIGLEITSAILQFESESAFHVLVMDALKEISHFLLCLVFIAQTYFFTSLILQPYWILAGMAASSFALYFILANREYKKFMDDIQKNPR